MKASYARPEQRRETRNDFPADQLFIVDLISSRHGVRTFGIVLNISKGGMAVQTLCPLPAGQIAEIRHCFSKTPFYTGAGQVVWKKEAGLAGLRFLNGRLKSLPELHHHLGESDGSPQSSNSALPLHACRNNSSTNAFDSTLHLLACSAMALTDAAGVAIVLGNSSVMECRASVGIAPGVGTQLHPDSGLSGHSLRTGSVILCNDAWADPRVNMAAAQQMDTRSILIVPITMAGSVVGLFEAFSRETNHFDERHVERLQPLVTVLASVPELETPTEAPEEAPEHMPILAAHDCGAIEDVDEEPEREEPHAAAADPTEIAEELTGAAPGATEVAATEPAITGMIASQELNRSGAVPLAGGMVAVLLIVLAAMAWYSYRLRTKSPEIGNSIHGTQNSQPSNAGASGQAAIAAAKPEISFDPPVINQKAEGTFDVNVVLKNAGNILSAPMQIRYDPKILQVITVTSGGLFDHGGQPGTLDRRVDASAGTIDLTMSRPLSVPGIPGNGSLVTLTFRSKVAGRSRLQVNPVELRDSSSRLTLVTGAEAVVDVSPSPTKDENKTPKPTNATNQPQTKPASPIADSAPAASRPATEPKVAPEAPLKASASVEPETPTEEAAALIMEGVPQGSEVWLDSQPLTATAPSGKVAIRNIPPGTHHLRMSLHNYQYYDQFLDLKPGDVVNVAPHTSGPQTGGI